MNLVNEIFTEKIVFSLGWTFINSLWQGGFICIVNAIILLMLSKQSSRLRYYISTVSLFTIFIFAVWSFFTLSTYYDNSYLSRGLSSVNGLNNTVSDGISELFLLRLIPFNSSGYFEYFNNNLPLILTIWFWSVIFLSLKQLGGFAMTQRLGYYKTTEPETSWQLKLDLLAKKVGIKKTVKLMESAIVKVPTVIGFLRPIILIPLGLAAGIPVNQIEAILIHELAHIKRRDYFINILQNILEVIFFFNPFVWLLSSVIRSEREHCCDDIAVQVSGDSISFIKALANIGAMDSVKSDYAMALSLNQNQLFKRIDRIMKMKNYKSNYSRLFISVLLLIVSITFMSTSAMGDYSYKAEKSTITESIPKFTNPYQDYEPQAQSTQQTKESSEVKMKKEQLIKELKKKYESATDEETKKKIEEKIWSIKNSDVGIPVSKDSKELTKKELIMELKKKAESTTDEETKRKLEKKIQSLKSGDTEMSKSHEFKDQEKKQLLMDLKKKYESATDEETKKKLEKKIQSLKTGETIITKSREFTNQEKEQLLMDLKKKYESTTDEETKKKLEKKIQSLKTGEIEISESHEFKDQEKKQMIMELKKKYEAATDEKTKKKIEEKIKSLKEK